MKTLDGTKQVQWAENIFSGARLAFIKSNIERHSQSICGLLKYVKIAMQNILRRTLIQQVTTRAKSCLKG